MRVSAVAGIMAIAAAAVAAQGLASFDEVRPVLEAMRDQLPEPLATLDEAAWRSWSREQDAAIRARLERGELDSMVHLLLFGTSFTAQPRIEFASLAEAARSGLLRSRVDDLARGLRSPGGNERLEIIRQLIRRRGIDPDAGDARTGLFLYENLQRVLRENAELAGREQAELAQAGSPRGDRRQEAPREPLFRDRGVSLDASLTPNFVLEEALRDLKNRSLLAPGGVTRAAVIGPGLDFTDKQSGYDYYPQQTLQPFALYDSLRRLELAPETGLTVTVFDISSRVLEHLQGARERARRGLAYVVQLPRDPRAGWTPAAVDYWSSFGDRVGSAATPIAPPAELSDLDTRSVEIRPEIVLACEPIDLNIVLGRLNLPEADRFDLIVATNVFVYYDRLAQALALRNVSTLLKPGGVLLTNDALPELPQVPMRRIDGLAVRYSDRFGESVSLYRRD